MKRINRFFKGSLLEGLGRFGEHHSFKVDFSSDCAAETTIFDFLTALGLSLAYMGPEFLMCIITSSVNSLHLSRKLSDYYGIAAKKYDVSVKVVEMAVIRAVGTITTDKIRRVNKVFGCDVLELDDLCAASFLSAVCSRFIMLKSHAVGKTYFSAKED